MLAGGSGRSSTTRSRPQMLVATEITEPVIALAGVHKFELRSLHPQMQWQKRIRRKFAFAFRSWPQMPDGRKNSA